MAMSTDFEWCVREVDLRPCFIPQVLEYLQNCCMKHFWIFLFHDGSVECEILDEYCQKLQYYHLFVWFKMPKKATRKNYFSNIPFMQFLRRIYSCKNELCYPTVFKYDDLMARLISLVNSSHRLMKEESNISYWIKDELESHL